MDEYSHAVTMAKSRLLIIERHLVGWTSSAIVQSLGISRKRDILPPPKPRRYERKTPGEIIHIDIKKLAKIDGVGHRIHGDRTQGR